MANSQNILTYPVEMLEALVAVAEGDVVSYPMDSRTEALNLRSRFYTLRGLLRQSTDPMLAEAKESSEYVTFHIIGSQLNLEPKSAYLRRKMPQPLRSQS